MGKITREFWYCDVCKAEDKDKSFLSSCVRCKKNICVDCLAQVTYNITAKTTEGIKQIYNKTEVYCKECLENPKAIQERILSDVSVNVQFSN